MPKVLPKYTLGEELVNAISHGLGAVLGVVGTVLLALKAVDTVQRIAAIVYGCSLVLMFAMSCLYHTVTAQRAKYVLRVFDHSAVSLLIAGTYTPYTMIALRGTLGWVLLAIVWGCAILNIVLSAVNMEKFKTASMVCYIASGWCILPALNTLLQSMTTPGIWLLFLGGVVYTVGIVFYKLKKIPYMHAVWHIFVIAGAVLQYWSLYGYVFG